jgi:hypothetical protein
LQLTQFHIRKAAIVVSHCQVVGRLQALIKQISMRIHRSELPGEIALLTEVERDIEGCPDAKPIVGRVCYGAEIRDGGIPLTETFVRLGSPVMSLHVVAVTFDPPHFGVIECSLDLYKG